MLEHGYKVGHSTVEGWWLDTGKKDDILYANSMLLDEQIERKIEGETINSQIYGKTAIGQYTKVSDSIIRGPIVIGNNCLIKSSFIGPYTSVGNNSKIVNSGIEYSVVMENTTIEDMEKIEESLIGKNSRIRKNSKQRALKFNIGEYSEIEF
jgi:glucose-1-phosphate thymidylyltransferase